MVALFVAAVMLAVGFVLWPFVRRAVPALPGSDATVYVSAELRLQQAALYETLRELEFAHQAGQYTLEDYQRLRQHYEQQAAAVLQALDRQGHDAAAPSRTLPTPPQVMVRRRGRWLWQTVVACALVLVGLSWGWWLGRATSVPPDVPSLLTAAEAALQRDDVPAALQHYRAVLEQSPGNATALTRLGILAQRAGQAEVGARLIERALQGQPRYLPAWQAKGMVHYSQGDYQKAIAAWETYLRLVADGDPHRQPITTLIMRAKQRLQAAQTSKPSAEVVPAAISGTIRLAIEPSPPLPPGAVLFIIGRTASGPPLAVKRIVDPQFPVHYTLGAEDVMVPGRVFSGVVSVSARLQISGTVGSLQPGDLVGHYAGNPVANDASGVDMVLTPQR